MTIIKKNNSNPNQFFTRIPENILDDKIPTMRSVLIFNRPEEIKEDEEKISSSKGYGRPGL
ncbi:hypothetical protein [Legionella genomosp. 1]|uniref:hypothetical protein n=1 Tax=Legionella genomosp. 1 TaxID=1093625 RepID=UPI001055A0E3|nr:hypothetical protein [Legionella genomosp. 1]